MVKIGDVVSRSAFVNDDKFKTTEYGVVVCIFPEDKTGTQDAYIAFTGCTNPKDINKQPKEKPYILRYYVETIDKVEVKNV